MNLLNIKDDVFKLLRLSEKCRNSDTRLVVSIWAKFLGKDVDKMTAIDLLNKFSENELPSYESITRVRRKLQENNPELRGSNYQEKQAEQKQVKEQLKKI